MTKSATESEYLSSYDPKDFDAPLTTVDIAIFTIHNKELKVLLSKRNNFPEREKWGLPGGFINLQKDADLGSAASRKLHEKTGLTTSHLEQVATRGNAIRDPRGWSVTILYMALIAWDELSITQHTTAEETKWAELQSILPQGDLAFDHSELILECFERLKAKVQYTLLPVSMLEKTFTLTELQEAFQIILGQDLEKKSFRRRVLESQMLIETDQIKRGSNRPAKLYEAKKHAASHYFVRNIEGSRAKA